MNKGNKETFLSIDIEGQSYFRTTSLSLKQVFVKMYTCEVELITSMCRSFKNRPNLLDQNCT